MRMKEGLERVRQRVSDPHASLDSLCNALLMHHKGQPKHKRQKLAGDIAIAKCGRHVQWHRAADYVCVAEGRPFANAADIDARWAAGDITLADMYIFKHCDAGVLKRSQVNPVWEAVYLVSDRNHYVKVQKCHLRQAYERAGRTDASAAWTADPLPYWVDRHAFSVLKIK